MVTPSDFSTIDLMELRMPVFISVTMFTSSMAVPWAQQAH